MAGVRFDFLRLGVDVKVVDGGHRARRAEDLEDHLLGVERDDLVGEAAIGRRVVVRAEDSVQAIDGKSHEGDYQCGDQDHPAASDDGSNRNPLHPLAFRSSGDTVDLDAKAVAGAPRSMDSYDSTVLNRTAQETRAYTFIVPIGSARG